MSKQQIKKARTLIKFAIQQSNYDEGIGAQTSWETIRVPIGVDCDGNLIETDCFYCEWLGSYGVNAIQQQADGNLQTARIRLPFVKAVYDALLTKDVRIYKYGKTDKANTFCLNSSPDNYLEENKMLEFQVKRHEVK